MTTLRVALARLLFAVAKAAQRVHVTRRHRDPLPGSVEALAAERTGDDEQWHTWPAVRVERDDT